MANKFYAKGAELTGTKQVDWVNDDIRVLAVSNGYVVDLETHDFLDDVSAFALSSGVALTGKSFTAGYFNADDIDLTVTAGNVKALIFYLHNADPTLAALLAYVSTILGFPFDTAGGVLPVVWPNGTKKILSLRGG